VSKAPSCSQNYDDADDNKECQIQHEQTKRNRRIPRSSLEEMAHKELMEKICQRIADPMEGLQVIIFYCFR
jgi:hypothetical protein